MNARIAVPVAAAILLLLAAPASAASRAPRLTPAQVAERIDAYRTGARLPGTYRALAGLGDPRVANRRDPYDLSDERFRLQRLLLPETQVAGDHLRAGEEGECRPDYAIETLRARIARLGEQHPYVRQWVAVQRAVFSACRVRPWRRSAEERTRLRPAVSLPPPLAISDPALAQLQRDDRAYQAASLLFYRRDAGAKAAFAAAARTASPHAPIARYMVAAAEIGEYDFYVYEQSPEAARAGAASRAALAEARAILADPALASIHPLAQGLIGFIGYHVADPESRAAQIDATLDALEAPLRRLQRDRSAPERYRRAGDDMFYLREEFDDPAWWLNGSTPRHRPLAEAIAAEARRRPIAAYLLLQPSPFEAGAWAAADASTPSWRRLRAYARQQARREQGRAWRLFLSSLATRYDPSDWREVDALVRAARRNPTDANLAAVAPAFYHQVRRALTDAPRRYRRRRFAEALRRIDAWPWRDTAFYRELVGDMIQYLAATGRIAEARRLRGRARPPGDEWDRSAPSLRVLLAEDEDAFVRAVAAAPAAGLEFMNLLPARRLARLAERTELPARTRARFARVAWTRLYALGRPIPPRLDATMRRLNPEITASWTSRPGGSDARALLLDVLRSPGLNILIHENQRRHAEEPEFGWRGTGLVEIDTFEHSDNNWWCAWQPARQHRLAASALADALIEDRGWDRDTAPAPVLDAARLAPLLRASWVWQAQDPEEQAALSAIESAPQRLAEGALAWRGEGVAEGQEEALALAVRATRYGCQRQGGHGRWSRAAHALLHSRFAGGPWARRTRWWFDCAHFSSGHGCRAFIRDPDPEPWTRWADRLFALR
jgi:hypothetical protein